MMPIMLHCTINHAAQPGSCYIQEARTSNGGKAAVIKFSSDRVITLFGSIDDEGVFQIASMRWRDPFKEDIEGDLKGHCYILQDSFSCTAKFEDGKDLWITGSPR